MPSIGSYRQLLRKTTYGRPPFGRIIDMIPDSWGRVRLRLPQGKEGKLEVNYEGPWAAGCGAGLIAALFAAGLLFAGMKQATPTSTTLPTPERQTKKVA